MKRKRRARTTTTRIPDQPCPACGAPTSAATGVDLEHPLAPARPEAGSWVVCIDCGTINVFDEARALRLATREELREAPALVRRMRDWVRRDRPSRRGFFQ
jgi:hypothetical protein